MHLVVDVREAVAERKTGKGFWTHRCVEELLQRDNIEVTLLTNKDVPSSWKSSKALRDVVIMSGSGILWHLKARHAAMRAKADVYLSPTSFIVPMIGVPGSAVVPVVHDLIAFEERAHDRRAQWIELLTLNRALKNAAAVCTVSDATKKDLLEQFLDVDQTIIQTVYAGPTWNPPPSWTAGGSHILAIGTLCPRKNQLTLIHAYSLLPEHLRSKHRLLLVGGRGWDDEEIVRTASNTPGVEWLGYQSDDECKKLLATCALFASVSFAEGFNLPVLDALAAGAPLVASDIPVAREIVDDAARLVDPNDPASIAHGLEQALTNPDEERRLRGKKRAESFTWAATVDRVLETCHVAVDNM